ncbi:MAG: hypothetical protein OSJ72_12435 [Lachnospiraceae bacterium]|nr:hypothetical protein [Lachnospiraceae bacterium]
MWDLSDFANILIAYCNIPLLYLGFSYVKRATDHFEKQDGTPFTSKAAGRKCLSGMRRRGNKMHCAV